MIERLRARQGSPLSAAIAGALLALGCAPTPPSATLLLVEPAQGFTDHPVILRVDVAGLRPSLEIDVGKGTLTADLQSVKARLVRSGTSGDDAVPLQLLDWDSHRNFWVRVPAAIDPGTYALDLTEPRGQALRLEDAFVALGADAVPPNLQLVQEPAAMPVLAPDVMIGEGQQVDATLIANDGWGAMQQVHWQTSDGATGDCAAVSDGAAVKVVDPRSPAPREISCPVRWTVPRLPDEGPAVVPGGFLAWARDLAGNEVRLDLALRIGRQPTIIGFDANIGALGGAQPFTVRGRGFIAGSRALLNGVPILGAVPGGDVQNEGLISGWTPPRNRTGPVPVQVISPAGTATSDLPFTYVGPPRPREIKPNHGSRLGGFRVTISGNDLGVGATAFVGASIETRQRLTYSAHDPANRTKLTACMPPGSGTVSVWIYDPIAGDGLLPMAFTYDEGESAGPGGASLPTEDCR